MYCSAGHIRGRYCCCKSACRSGKCCNWGNSRGPERPLQLLPLVAGSLHILQAQSRPNCETVLQVLPRHDAACTAGQLALSARATGSCRSNARPLLFTCCLQRRSRLLHVQPWASGPRYTRPLQVHGRTGAGMLHPLCSRGTATSLNKPASVRRSILVAYDRPIIVHNHTVPLHASMAAAHVVAGGMTWLSDARHLYSTTTQPQ